jgi:hypothetical protein
MTEEGEIQKQVFAELRSRGMPGHVAWHCPNDRASPRKAGFMRGVHDVHILYGGKFFSLELKTDKGDVKVEQLLFRDRINDAGGYSQITYGLTEALNWLEGCGLLKGRAI